MIRTAILIVICLAAWLVLSGQTPHGTVYEETPAGVIDGTNATFTIAHQPLPWAAIKLYRNGMRLKRFVAVAGTPAGTFQGDYMLDTSVFSSTKIVFQPACIPSCIPQVGDTLLADYTY